MNTYRFPATSFKATVAAVSLAALFAGFRSAAAEVTPAQLITSAEKSLVGVKFTWDREDGKREFVVLGTVVSNNGLIMLPGPVFAAQIPDDQLTGFKILIPRPGAEPTEVPAVFAGRDERYDLAYVQAQPAADSPPANPITWQPLAFNPAELSPGQTVYSVGRLTKNAGYTPYFAQGQIAAVLRGEIPTVLTLGNLTVVGSPVFNQQGQAVGYVNAQEGQLFNLDDRERAAQILLLTPKFFTPASDFLPSLSSPPAAGTPMPLPWTGIAQLSGVRKEVAELYGITDTPAVEVGDVIPDSAAQKAGLVSGNIISAINGKPIPPGDETTELPDIFRRIIQRLPVGSSVDLTVLTAVGQPAKQVSLTLEAQPPRPNTAPRQYFEDLGFTVRALTFIDTYSRRIPADSKGAVVSFVKQQSSAATSGLRPNDMVSEINGKPVDSLDTFASIYKDLRANSPREAVVLVVLRDGKNDTIRIEPPR